MARLDRLIARNLGASRKQVTMMVKSGMVVFPDGNRPRDPGLIVDDAALPLTVSVDGEDLILRDRFSLLLNKPPGYVTALRDREHPISAQLVSDAPLFEDLRAVGRLDKDTTGLLIWTTDGQMVHRLTHPRSQVPRTYQAALARPHAPCTSPLVLDDGHQPQILALDALHPDARHPALRLPNEPHVLSTISIVGGAYHEVRRIYAALGSHVLELCRVGFGALSLPVDLPLGSWMEIENMDAVFPT